MTWNRVVTIALGLTGIWYALTGKSFTKRLLIIASVMSALWVMFYNYDYNSDDQIKIGRLNLMTFVAWTCGLLAVGIWWCWISQNTEWSLAKKLIVTGVLWTVSIMAIEWIGYNWMKIRLNSDYPGLFGLNLMHGPQYLKMYYLSAWAAFLFLAFSPSSPV